MERNPDLESMEQAWKDALQDAWGGGMTSDADMERLFNNAMGQDFGNIWPGSLPRQEYEFKENNQYVDAVDPLAEALRLLREGRDHEALLALEAEVQKNPESSEGWRMLGQLYAEMDRDPEAIQCLRKGHEVDPYNLDSLLALGVSCTNELDQLPALRYLRLWIENHEEHGGLVAGLEAPPEYELEAWKQQVASLYNQAAMANPLDANVFVALGVMENISRNYDAAIAAFATACRLRPNDHTVWNKLGATLANSGKSEKAVTAYHQGLQLKPNYARSWSNLAIAHANLNQHQEAARFYLSSLVLSPEAKHIWGFLHSAVLNMNNHKGEGNTNMSMIDLKAIESRDLAACTQVIHGVLDPQTLPKPTQELPTPPDEILASIGL
jgi:peroxin-5